MELVKQGEIEKWATLNYQFIGRRFGYENIVEFTCHMDERTPHIHCVLVPIKNDRLSAKNVMGDRIELQKLQTAYAEKMKDFGLNRGIEGSKATHDSVKEYYGRIDKALAEAKLKPEEQPKISFELTNFNSLEIAPPKLLDNKTEWAQNTARTILEASEKDIDENIKKGMENAFRMLEMASNKLVLSQEQEARARKENAQMREELKRLKLDKAKLEAVNKEKEGLIDAVKGLINQEYSVKQLRDWMIKSDYAKPRDFTSDKSQNMGRP
jgi:hypothetical protein